MAAADGPSAADDEGPTEVKHLQGQAKKTFGGGVCTAENEFLEVQKFIEFSSHGM